MWASNETKRLRIKCMTCVRSMENSLNSVVLNSCVYIFFAGFQFDSVNKSKKMLVKISRWCLIWNLYQLLCIQMMHHYFCFASFRTLLIINRSCEMASNDSINDLNLVNITRGYNNLMCVHRYHLSGNCILNTCHRSNALDWLHHPKIHVFKGCLTAGRD